LILNFIADQDPQDELFQNLKDKKINQKFIYFDSGATGYYSNVLYQPAPEDFIKFATSQITGPLTETEKQVEQLPEKKTAFISLGCGNTFEEVKILKNCHSNVTLFGIDSSAAMLELSAKNLTAFEFNNKLIQADFTTLEFRENLQKMLVSFARRIFYISGFTFCNFNPEIVKLLYNLMQPGDILIFYVMTIVNLKAYNEIFIADARDTLKNEAKINSYFGPLNKLKIPRNRGKFIMDAYEEQDIGSLCFQFSFKFSRKTKVIHKKETLKFLPGEKIIVQTIRVYDYETLRGFFAKSSFNFVDLEVHDNINVIYAFEKV
jgi:hypothetical protein